MILYDSVIDKHLLVIWEQEGKVDELPEAVSKLSLGIIGDSGYIFGYRLKNGSIVDLLNRPLKVIHEEINHTIYKEGSIEEDISIEESVVKEESVIKKKEDSFWDSPFLEEK